MRIPKYKVWDNGEKRLIIHSELMERDQEVMCIYTALTDEESLKVNKWIPLQYTGLKDMNGRDIYEGDICEYEDGEHSFIAIIEPDYVNWYLKGISPKENFNINGFHDCGKSWLKIIGNVFENPELIEEPHYGEVQ